MPVVGDLHRRNPDLRLHLGDTMMNLHRTSEALREYRLVHAGACSTLHPCNPCDVCVYPGAVYASTQLSLSCLRRIYKQAKAPVGGVTSTSIGGVAWWRKFGRLAMPSVWQADSHVRGLCVCMPARHLS